MFKETLATGTLVASALIVPAAMPAEPANAGTAVRSASAPCVTASRCKWRWKAHRWCKVCKRHGHWVVWCPRRHHHHHRYYYGHYHPWYWDGGWGRWHGGWGGDRWGGGSSQSQKQSQSQEGGVFGDQSQTETWWSVSQSQSQSQSQ